MNFQPDRDRIMWKIHLDSATEEVFRMLATSAGRAGFWAETAEEKGGEIQFVFPNGWEYNSKIIHMDAPSLFQIDYFGSRTTFELEPDGKGGTFLTLTDEGVPEKDRCEITAGWVSVLMALKAAVDHGIDLRNHDPDYTWDQGFVEN